jgi:hypothetical protein
MSDRMLAYLALAIGIISLCHQVLATKLSKVVAKRISRWRGDAFVRRAIKVEKVKTKQTPAEETE